VVTPRGQAHTLEGVIAGLVLLTALIFALQMTAVTPLTASTSSQHVETQQQSLAAGVLSAAAETGALERAVLYWNETGGTYHDAPDVGYYTSTPDNDFGQMLARTLGDRGITYNVRFYYPDQGIRTLQRRYLYRGDPSDNAVSAGYSLAITDDQNLIDADGSVNETITVAQADRYFATDTASDRSLYTVVRVEVIAWRI
jgi:hypothetical protein